MKKVILHKDTESCFEDMTNDGNDVGDGPSDIPVTSVSHAPCTSTAEPHISSSSGLRDQFTSSQSIQDDQILSSTVVHQSMKVQVPLKRLFDEEELICIKKLKFLSECEHPNPSPELLKNIFHHYMKSMGDNSKSQNKDRIQEEEVEDIQSVTFLCTRDDEKLCTKNSNPVPNNWINVEKRVDYYDLLNTSSNSTINKYQQQSEMENEHIHNAAHSSSKCEKSILQHKSNYFSNTGLHPRDEQELESEPKIASKLKEEMPPQRGNSEINLSSIYYQDLPGGFRQPNSSVLTHPKDWKNDIPTPGECSPHAPAVNQFSATAFHDSDKKLNCVKEKKAHHSQQECFKDYKDSDSDSTSSLISPLSLFTVTHSKGNILCYFCPARFEEGFYFKKHILSVHEEEFKDMIFRGNHSAIFSKHCCSLEKIDDSVPNEAEFPLSKTRSNSLTSSMNSGSLSNNSGNSKVQSTFDGFYLCYFCNGFYFVRKIQFILHYHLVHKKPLTQIYHRFL